MKRIKKITAFVMTLVIIFSVSLTAFGAETPRNKYPVIFIHGMFGWGLEEGINNILPYWGATTGDLMEYLNSKNVEAYDVSVGPVSSAWDNACEVYAKLTGTQVDYGEAHSKEHNHSRFGRTYAKPLIDKWDKNNKIHIVGHSHGGQVARLLAHLLTYGDQNEKDISNKNNISPLFIGGKEAFVESVTTICTPNNGTSAYDVVRAVNILTLMENVVCLYAGILGRGPLNGTLVDFHLEQFGITAIPGEEQNARLFSSIRNFRHSKDTVTYDLSHEGSHQLNNYIKISPNINYFCYTADATSGEYNLPANAEFFFLAITSFLMRLSGVPNYDCGIEYDDSWLSNDGLVNTESGKNPYNEPAKEYDGIAEAGVWNIMPTIIGDHGTPIGLFADKNKTHAFYDEFTDILIELE